VFVAVKKSFREGRGDQTDKVDGTKEKERSEWGKRDHLRRIEWNLETF